MKVLVTCPPMLGAKDQFIPLLENSGLEAVCPDVVQTLSIEELKEIVPTVSGWIIGDDPATREVFEAGKKGNLKAAVKWGIGVDNVDFNACKDLSIPIINTPDMFGREVADIAINYIIGLARQTFFIDREIRAGAWPKPQGRSLSGKTVGVVGYGDIGKNTVSRLGVFGMDSIVYDPAYQHTESGLPVANWPDRIGECDFIVFTCGLNQQNRHMLNSDVLTCCKEGVYVVNVARGPLIDERALEDSISSGRVAAVALDVFEKEPLPMNSRLRQYPACIFGSHNGSNTLEAVHKTNIEAINRLKGFLGIS